MTVQSILVLKGGNVATGTPSMTLAEVCAQLAEKRIGALVIIDGEERVAGIVSERDVVRAVASGGGAALAQPVSRHMTSSVVTCTRNHSVNSVMETMTRGRFRHLPVVEEGKLVGIVSIGDVVKHRIAEVEREAEEIRNYIATA